MKEKKKAFEVLKEKIVKVFSYKIKPFFLIFPYGIIKIKSFQHKSIDDLIDFCFNGIGGVIRPLQVRDEILELVRILDETKPEVIAEIGTATGGTLFLFSRIASKNATLISIDLPGGIFGGGYSRVKKPFYHSFGLPTQKIHLIRADSHEPKTFEKIRGELEENKIDFLFIDGDHTYEGVRKDFEMYSPLVKENGIIAFHDIAIHAPEIGSDVDKFWNEIKGKYRHIELIKDPKQGSCGIGVMFLDRNKDLFHIKSF